MASGNSVVIKIKGDDSNFRDVMKAVGNTAKAGLADVKAGIDMTTAAMRALMNVAKMGIDYNAQMEQLKTSFETMTGSAEKAAEVVERLRVMGAETPFEAMDLASTTQMLMQYGFTADEAIDRLRMLGDISQGNANALTSIAMGYAQMSSAGKVNLQDIKQMINGGFNPLMEISKRTGESMESLYDRISKGTMSVEEITESMRYATSAGGQFFQAMEKQSKTLNGQISTLKDNVMQLLGSMTGDLSQEMAESFLPMVNGIVGELQAAFDQGGFDGLVNAATDMLPDLLGMLTGQLEQAMSGLTRWMPTLAQKLLKSFPGALKAASNLLPQITTALFGIASEVVTGLVGMLPELVPVLAEGLVGLVQSASAGIVQMLGSVVLGIEQAFHKGYTKVLGEWVSNDAIAKFNFDLEVDPDVDVNTDALPDVPQEIFNALSDGLTDTEQVVSELNGKIETYTGTLLKAAETQYQNAVLALDPNDPEYEQKVAAIKADYEATVASIGELKDNMVAYVNTYAGATTETVKAAEDQIKRMEELAGELEEKTGLAREAEKSQGEIAYNVTRSGAKVDEQTISAAISFKYREFKLDELSAQDAYDKATKELMAKLDAGEINQTEYNSAFEAEQAKLAEAQAAAKAAYETALGQIFLGIAKSEGVGDQVMNASANAARAAYLNSLAAAFEGMSLVELAAPIGKTLSSDVIAEIAAALNMDAGELSTAFGGAVAFALMDAQGEWQNASAEAAGIMETSVGEAYAAALEAGALEGTTFDQTTSVGQFSALLASIGQNAATDAAPEVAAAGTSLGETATAAMADYDGAFAAGSESVGGLNAALQAAGYVAYAQGYNAGKQFDQGYRDAQQIQSPSKVMRKLGTQSMQGLIGGYRDMMQEAVNTARYISGQMVTAASFTGTSRLTMPDLTAQLVAAANNQQPTPINLDGTQIAEIQAGNNSRSIAFENSRYARAVGGK